MTICEPVCADQAPMTPPSFLRNTSRISLGLQQRVALDDGVLKEMNAVVVHAELGFLLGG